MIAQAIQRYRRDLPDHSRYPIIWREKEYISDEVVEALVVILKTSGCYWSRSSGCIMCGYNKNARSDTPGLDMQLGTLAKEYRGEKIVKIYTSGSFLDPGEVPLEVAKKVFSLFKGSKKIVIETRPEFISRERIEDIIRVAPQVEIAIGLESSSDETLARCINKGIAVEDYIKSAELIRSMSVGLRTYILLKPPFFSEKRAIKDALDSIMFASRYSDIISLNPVTVHSGTLVEHLYRRKEYRPPWLWSIDYVLREHPVRNAQVICSTMGFGSRTGPHNCGKCDEEFKPLVERYNLTGELPDRVNCMCRKIWERELVEGQLLCGLPTQPTLIP